MITSIHSAANLTTMKIAYRFYYFTSSLRYWISTHFTNAGILALIALPIAALLGLDTNKTMTYQVFTLLLALIVISLIFSIFFKNHFSVSRSLPKFVTAGKPFNYMVTIRNHTLKNQAGLVFNENFDDPRPSFTRFANAREPREEHRNILDRTFGYYRWRWLISVSQKASAHKISLKNIPAQGEITAKIKILPQRRGRIRINTATIARPDPLGLFNALVHIPGNQSLIVLPKRYRTSPVQLPGTRKYHQGGISMAASVGESEEFVSIREYRSGDPLRKIHWKGWAKSGKPMVKEYQEEFFSRHALILDTFTEFEYNECFEEAVSIAASFVADIDTQELLLDLMFIGTEAYCFTTGRGVGQAEQLLEILACLETCRNKSFQSLTNSVVNRANLLSGCICILTAWDKSRQDLIAFLKMQNIPLLVLLVTDSPDKIEPGIMKDDISCFHVLEIGKIKDQLTSL